jgi:hypothetical protein
MKSELKMEKNSKTRRHMKIVGLQIIIILVVLAVVYFLYPKIDVSIDGTQVNFKAINANVIVLSENPDFSNSRYLDFEERDNISFSLNPGTYYWKASNGYIEGLAKEFTIESEVGMKLEVEEQEANLTNIGNVKLNVSRNEKGMMVGHIILEPSQAENVENSGQYSGEEHENE